MKTNHSQRRCRSRYCNERGSSLVTVIILTAVVATFAGAALTFTSSAVDEAETERQELQALYLAEAAASTGLNQLALSRRTGEAVSAYIGTPDDPERMSGDHWANISSNSDDTYTIMATGSVGNSVRTIEIVAEPIPPGPFEHSMFAGNFSGDPAYGLRLGGYGSQADQITGNIYSGGDVVFEGHASINGDLRAGGTITGAPGQGGVVMALPQVLNIDYEQFHDFNVADLFENSTRLSDNSGGWADQLPSSDPGHIFRRNPSDRTSDTNSTVKDDYFLEDPYESIGVDWNQDGSDAFEVSLPESANNSVFFIDGNLWLHNRRTLSLKIKNTGIDPTRVTFVVKGNVYFSDNLFYTDEQEDGVAFIALADENVEDSGNIFFGDPVFGTMRFAESLLFAEGNFIDKNLDRSGNAEVILRGNMTAGDQVAIDRDFEHNNGTVAHTKLDLSFDPRQANGTLDLPGVPVGADHPVGYRIASWREVHVPESFEVESDTIQVQALQQDTPSTNVANSWRDRWEDRWGSAWRDTQRVGKWNSPGGSY